MKNIKKLLSLLLCGIMLFGMFPASLFAADGDTGDGSGTISETFVPEITWKRTFEYEHRHDTAANQHTNLGGLYAGDKTAYLSTESKTENSVTTYKNKVHWDWATLSGHFNGRTDDVDDSAHKVWDYGHTDVQYADPVKASITNPIASSSQIGGVGIIPYAPSAGEQAIFAATWNNRAAQAFDASSVDGTDISYSSDYVSVKKGQMDIGYGKKSNDSTISDFSGKSYTARRFSGSFVWPEGYTLSDSIELISKNDSYYQEIYNAIEADPDLKAAFGGKKVVAINDDMFVFVYKDGEQLTENNYSDYLAFFAGTAGKGVWSWPNADPQDASHGGSGVGWGGEWNVTEPATYGDKDKYASKAFYKVFPNLDTAGADRSMLSEKLIGKEATSTTTATAGMMALSDYWYSFMDGNAISTVLNNKYGTTGINAGDTVHIDIYCIDMDKVGGMDELEIRLTRQKPTTSSVTVRYWLNAVGETTGENYLGSTTMTGQEIGSLITLANGTDVNQLNHKRAAAITKANGDVSDGVQIELPFTVTEKSEDNIINVVYVPAGNKVVHLWAGSLEVPYDGSEHVVHNVKITQDGCNDITVSDSETNTWCELNDRDWYKNKITDITAQRKEIYPGIYVVDFARTSKVESYWGEQLNNYSIIYHPGTLKITYAPPAKTFVYDFGVQNSYKLTDVEEKAVGIQTVDETVKHVGFNGTDKSILYTPQSVNKGETIQTKLVFTGNYITEATSITFLPATNVLYEENFMTNRGGTTGEWKAEGTNSTATVVKDNENSVYGYADAYNGFAYYSNGGALKATLDLKGGKRTYTTDAVEFSFSGTGFDIISECGTDTGLLLVALSKGGNPFKVYIVDTYFCGDNSIGGNPPIPSIITGEGILDYQVPVVRAMNLERADYSVRILGYLTNTAGAIVGPASPTPWEGGETGAEGSTRGANGIDTNRILREAGLKEFIGCEVETSFMDENSVLNGGTGIAAKNSQNRTFGKRGEETAQTADVYLDAFRVYQPLELESEANYAENEKDLKYAPVYDYVKNSANSIGSEILPNSMVYVEYDGDTEIANIANYQDRGPQNEVYLTNGNYIGFVLEGYTGTETVMISAKAVAGDPVLGYLDTDTNAEGAVTPSGMKMTEMYYDVTDCVRQYGAKYMLVLGNIAEAGTGTGTRSILSVSGIKLANGIVPATSTQIAADIASLVTLAYQPVEEPVFTPERFELRYSGRALAGWLTRISVKTSTDVDHVSVYRLADDGSLVPVRENMRPMNSLFTYFGWMDYYAFSLTVRAPRRGMTDTYYIFAYDANGVASEPAIASITGR